jgi:hypothetical protein
MKRLNKALEYLYHDVGMRKYIIAPDKNMEEEGMESILKIKKHISDGIPLTESFKKSFLEALVQAQADMSKKNRVNAALQYLETNNLFIDAVSVAIYMNNGVVLHENDDIKNDLEELEKELQQHFGMYLNDNPISNDKKNDVIL